MASRDPVHIHEILRTRYREHPFTGSPPDGKTALHGDGSTRVVLQGRCLSCQICETHSHKKARAQGEISLKYGLEYISYTVES